jgi:glucokinase
MGFLDDSGAFERCCVIPNSMAREPAAILEEAASLLLANDPHPGGVGIGVAGLVDHASGILHFSPNLLSWGNLHLAEEFSRLSRAPVVVDNDCNVFAYGAVAGGLIPRSGVNIMLTLGTGIGGTIVVDGRIIYGTGFAGEMGHMPVDADGIECPCGSRGCWELYAAKSALIRYYSALGGRESEPVEIAGLARAGGESARSAFGELGKWFGTGLAGLANIFSPSGFYIGGGLTGAWDLFSEPARIEYGLRCRHPWVVHVLQFHSEAGASGAAMMARDRAAAPGPGGTPTPAAAK